MVLILKKGATEEEMRVIKKKLRVKSRKAGAGVNLKKYAGTIKLKEDPLAIQKKLRDEWG